MRDLSENKIINETVPYLHIKDTGFAQLGELFFKNLEDLESYKMRSRTISEAAWELRLSKEQLVKYLKMHGLLEENDQNVMGKWCLVTKIEHSMLGYFEQDFYDENGDTSIELMEVFITPKGIEAITQLIQLLNPSQL
ncbi:MAG: hypothetical protein ACJAX3_001612 [Patiriisocius sp.]|jgi:hypothetical protein